MTIFRLTTPIIFDILTHAHDHIGPSKIFYNFSIYEKTVNYKNSQKVPFGSLRGPLQITN